MQFTCPFRNNLLPANSLLNPKNTLRIHRFIMESNYLHSYITILFTYISNNPWPRKTLNAMISKRLAIKKRACLKFAIALNLCLGECL